MDAFLYRLKAAQFDLIEACGGIARTAEKSGYGSSTVGRWNDRNDPTVMPIAAVVTLERDCARAFVTTVMAGANGRRLSDPQDDQAQQVSILTAHAGLMRQSAELAGAVAVAIADGHVSPTEAHTIDRVMADLERQSSELRIALARIKAQGGAKAALVEGE